jgi:hypothetical protein
MTPTTKPVRRMTTGTTWTRGRSRRLAVTIGPGDIITIRAEKLRLGYQLPIETAFRYAARVYAWTKAQERRTRK